MVEFVGFFEGEKNVERNALELSTSRGVVVMVTFFLAFFVFFCLCGEGLVARA